MSHWNYRWNLMKGDHWCLRHAHLYIPFWTIGVFVHCHSKIIKSRQHWSPHDWWSLPMHNAKTKGATNGLHENALILALFIDMGNQSQDSIAIISPVSTLSSSTPFGSSIEVASTLPSKNVLGLGCASKWWPKNHSQNKMNRKCTFILIKMIQQV